MSPFEIQTICISNNPEYEVYLKEDGMATTAGIRGFAPSAPERLSRKGPTIFGFLVAMFLLPVGATLALFGVGIPTFVIGLALLLRD
jgi:hypothetical protein